MENISVVACVYNEEKRIERFLKSFICFDEIIIVDKTSTDNTAVLCRNNRVRIVTVPYSDRGDIGIDAVKSARNNWVLLVTASDVIHPDLVRTMLDLINKDNFSEEVVFVPHITYCNGISSAYSVFNTGHKPCLIKKNIVVLNDRVHNEISYNTKKIYYLPQSGNIAILHLTHQSIESSFERAFRYSREEVKKNESNESLGKCLKHVCGAIALGIRRKFWKLGWDGLAMMFLLLNYYIMVFLRVWEKKRNVDVESYYNELADKL